MEASNLLVLQVADTLGLSTENTPEADNVMFQYILGQKFQPGQGFLLYALLRAVQVVAV